MKTVTSKAVRHSLPRVMRLLKAGQPVQVTQRGKPLFEIHPPARAWTPPDFSAVARQNTGKKYRRVSLFDGLER